jgi:hypothetical protein
MSSTKKWFTGIVAVVSVVYKVTEKMEYMRPIVSWLDKRIGGDTLIEILLGALVLYLLVSHGEKDDSTSQPIPQASLTQSPVQTVSPTISPIIDASQHHHYAEPTKKETPPAPSPVRRRTPNIVAKRMNIVRLSDVGNILSEPRMKAASRL